MIYGKKYRMQIAYAIKKHTVQERINNSKNIENKFNVNYTENINKANIC